MYWFDCYWKNWFMWLAIQGNEKRKTFLKVLVLSVYNFHRYAPQSLGSRKLCIKIKVEIQSQQNSGHLKLWIRLAYRFFGWQNMWLWVMNFITTDFVMYILLLRRYIIMCNTNTGSFIVNQVQDDHTPLLAVKST